VDLPYDGLNLIYISYLDRLDYFQIRKSKNVPPHYLIKPPFIYRWIEFLINSFKYSIIILYTPPIR